MNQIYLPLEVLNKIHSYDSTYYLRYGDCINQLKKLISKHKSILTTYNCVIEEDKLLFKNFSPIFYKFLILNVNI